MKSWISYASAGSTRPGQRFRNSSSVIKRDASNVGCGFVRSRPPGPATDRNCKSFQRQRRRLAVQRLCARILKTWGAKREDAWRLRWRTGSASVRSWLFLASQPLRPCQLHHFNFARRQRNAEFLNFGLRLRPFGNAQQDAQVLGAILPRVSAPVVEHTRYNSSRKRRPLNQPAGIAVLWKDPAKTLSVLDRAPCAPSASTVLLWRIDHNTSTLRWHQIKRAAIENFALCPSSQLHFSCDIA
jgi:hypothetical protein